ncbi:MAG: hypothetical protein IIA88_08305 [Bacteroidetes bacterium]|nr:hypothetical protein [Bacteroidota bacterium]
MSKEDIEKLIKIKIDLLKIYLLLLVGLITAEINFLLRYIENNEKIILYLFILGLILLIIIAFIANKTHSKIKELIKDFKK